MANTPAECSILEHRDSRTDSYLSHALLDRGSEHLDAYLSVYARLCEEAAAESTKHIAGRVHQDIVRLVAQLKTNTFEKILLDLQETHPGVSDTALVQTIELAARVVTMHEVGRWKTSASGQRRLDWTTGRLSDALEAFYKDPELGEVKFERLFDISALERVAGFKLEWTSNLAEHLAIHDLGDKHSVRVFQHATWLNAVNKELFPVGFIDETLDTLALLLPSRRPAVVKWFKKKSKQHEHPSDQGMLSIRRLSPEDRHIESFHYWHDRLVLLKEAFDDTEPVTLKEWWYDRRKSVQRSTFWVAVLVLVLTVFFGLVQSIEGALQVYKAYYPR
ncbi:hypothetical protein AMS68_005383 [Peltaster fructicola]|uniref:Uncharacterized protein n=1 Tax=Peltaster fructicola TaxID=286661 RepID=A0A6H0XYV6_9PEZI|nr:hypothetical protein AMS68_005383 [Peltaster fructicola]